MNDELWKKIKNTASPEEDLTFVVELIRALVGEPITVTQVRNLIAVLADAVDGYGITGDDYERNLNYISALRNIALKIENNK